MSAAWMASLAVVLAMWLLLPPTSWTRAERAGLLDRPARPRRAAPPRPRPDPPPALVLELVAAVLEAGLPPPAVLRHVAAAVRVSSGPSSPLADALDHEAAVLEGDPLRVAGSWEVLRSQLGLATATGMAPAAPVRRAAAEQRRRSASSRTRSLRRLEIHLVLPTGLCLLPAFVLLGVAPVVIDLFLIS